MYIGRYVLVLERCNFVWILNNSEYEKKINEVLERCNFVWILNKIVVELSNR